MTQNHSEASYPPVWNRCAKYIFVFGSISLSVQFMWNLLINERIFRDNATLVLLKVMTLTVSNGRIGFEFDDSDCTEYLESFEKLKFKADWIRRIYCDQRLIETCLFDSYNAIVG